MNGPRTIIVGLGNPILGDDGVGWRVAQELQDLYLQGQRLQPLGLDADVECLALGGLSLMESLIGYDRAIIVDALHCCEGSPGRVFLFDLAELPDPSAGHSTAVHDTSLQTALRVGRALGARLPQEITIVAIEVESLYEFCEELSAQVEAAVPLAVQQVLILLDSACQMTDLDKHCH